MIRFAAKWAIIVALAATGPMAGAQDRISTSDERAYSAFSDDKHRQFDFWIGSWDVNLRTLQRDLSFRDSIAAKANIYSILNGKAILEFWDSELIKGYSVRYFDTDEDEWRLWLNWPSDGDSTMSTLTGEFRHGRGEFSGGFTTRNGRKITQHYSFGDITPYSLRWDDLFSGDNGKTWQMNWRMEFSRTAVEPHWPSESAAFPTYHTGNRCSDDAFRPYEELAGRWQGNINGEAARISAWRVLDGCAVIVFLSVQSQPSKERFMFITYETSSQNWEIDYLDDDFESDMLRLVSETDWSRVQDDSHSLSWDIKNNALSYRFQSGEQDLESGSFERQSVASP